MKSKTVHFELRDKLIEMESLNKLFEKEETKVDEEQRETPPHGLPSCTHLMAEQLQTILAKHLEKRGTITGDERSYLT
jgi:hypothetical protein